MQQSFDPTHVQGADWHHACTKTLHACMLTQYRYLTTPEEGGETVFPDAEHKVTGSQWSECARKGLAVKPFKGDAIMFYGCVPCLGQHLLKLGSGTCTTKCFKHGVPDCVLSACLQDNAEGHDIVTGPCSRGALMSSLTRPWFAVHVQAEARWQQGPQQLARLLPNYQGREVVGN